MRREVAHLTGEAEYCRRLDADLIERMRRCAELQNQRQRRQESSAKRQDETDRERRGMAEALKIDNPQLVQSLQKLGYTPATASLIYFAPMVSIAWADGAVSRAERRLILALANLQGVVPDTPAFSRLAASLERRPHQGVIEECWTALRLILESLPPEESDAKKECILHACRAVAAASGPILHKVCAAERRMLNQMELDLLPPAAVPSAGFP